MFENVIVGVDGKQGGRDAIALARRLAALDGTLTLVNVNAGYPIMARGYNGGFERVEHERSAALLDAERAAVEGELDVRWAASPSIGQGLHSVAEVLDADLLVVGSSSHGLAGRVLIGNDTTSALDGAPCAVAVAPIGYSDDSSPLREIGVGYNGSPESEHALGVARKLAGRYGTKLSAMHAVTLPFFRLTAIVDEIRFAVEDATNQIADLGGVEPHCVYGKAEEELTLYSASLDLLVLGSRSYGPLGRLLHGSTSRRLTQSCRSPLLVLTRGARAHEFPQPSAVGTWSGPVGTWSGAVGAWSGAVGADNPVLQGVADERGAV
jgi:nucleotide-binding universal stress UspA family protein